MASFPPSPQKKTIKEPDREVAHYVVTAHKPNSISHAIRCSFTDPQSDNLILAKSLRLEICDVNSTFLESGGSQQQQQQQPSMEVLLDVPVRGRIVTLQSFRPTGSDTDYLLYTTERKRYAILSYNTSRKVVETRSSGDWSDCVGREKEGAPICIIDPMLKCVICHFYDGFLNVIPMALGGALMDTHSDTFNVRLLENSALSMCFLGGTSTSTSGSADAGANKTQHPVIAYIYQDVKGTYHATTKILDMDSKKLIEGPWTLKYNPIDAMSTILFAHPPTGDNAVIIVGHKQITYYNGTTSKTVSMEAKIILCYGRVDENRYLLGDERGNLWLLVVNCPDNIVKSLDLECMGEINIPSTITYVTDGVVFIGTQYGDSELIHLADEMIDKGTHKSYIQSSTEYTSLGPILDFDTVTSNQQHAVVTCSGMGKNGTLRIVRNGIGMHEQAEVEIPGITALFAIHLPGDVYDKYLLQSFIHATRILAISDDEMAEDTIPGFLSHESTLYAGNISTGSGGDFDFMLQVTPPQIVLVRYVDGAFETVDSWKPEGANVTVASANRAGQVVIALRGGVVVSFQCDENGIRELARCAFEEEVSCINLNPVFADVSSMDIDNGGHDGLRRNNEISKLAAIGLWNDFTVRLVALPNLSQLHRIDLGSDTQPRSLVLSLLESNQSPMLFVGFGDGQLLSYQIGVVTDNSDSDGVLTVSVNNRKKVSLGTQAITLTAFQAIEGKTCVFAASDRPSIAYSSNGKTMYSNINITGDVTYACPFHCELFHDSLALASDDSLIIGTIDDIQKLHVHTFKLGETPRRIAYHEPGKVFCVGCVASENERLETNSVKFIDEGTFEEIEAIDLEPFEMVLSIISCRLGGSVGDKESIPRPYVVVGTAYAYPEEDEPGRGRILVFDCKSLGGNEMTSNNSLKPVRQVAEEHTTGGVYSLCNYMGNALFATINSRLKLYQFKEQDGAGQLTSVSSHHGHILSLFVKSKGEHAIVGDLMRSISAYSYGAKEGIEEIARDYNANWTTSCDILSSNVYLGAENWNNIYTLRRNTEATSEEARCRLNTQGRYYLGEMVNKFTPGSLVSSSGMDVDDQTVVPGSQTLYATVDGSLGSILGLDKQNYLFFKCLERSVAKVVPAIGGLSHEEFRSFAAEKRVQPCTNFVDGDLVESILDLSKDEMNAVVEHMNSDGTWELPDDTALVIGEEQDKMSTISLEEVIHRVEEMSRQH